MTINNFMVEIKEEIFSRFRDENEDDTEDAFDDTENMIDIKHEVIDYSISCEKLSNIEDMINEYGIGRAIMIVKDAGIELDGQNAFKISSILLYQIVFEILDDYLTYENYLEWKGEKSDE